MRVKEGLGHTIFIYFEIERELLRFTLYNNGNAITTNYCIAVSDFAVLSVKLIYLSSTMLILIFR